MVTPLRRISLKDLNQTPVMFDANILMVGIEDRYSDKNCSFESMKELYMKPLFESFQSIYIHEEVYKELDDDSKSFVGEYVGRNIKIVGEDGLYGLDPVYTTIFNNIANHELVKYKRGSSKDRGEVYSLAYAAFHKINFFCTREIMVDFVAAELEDLWEVNIITFDIVLLQAYVYYALKEDNSYSKGLKSMYKKYCSDVIKRHRLPKTLGEYIRACSEYL